MLRHTDVWLVSVDELLHIRFCAVCPLLLPQTIPTRAVLFFRNPEKKLLIPLRIHS